MADKQTPLMRQYTQIKNKHPETLLLFRLGDFFETFNEDAEITAKVCGIVLTKRNNGAAGDMPLAGFPHHQLDNYLPKLVRAGYRVAVCEQLEDPKLARGIVRRGVVEIVTPGVALYEKLLDTKKNNFIAAVALKKDSKGTSIGAAFADVSTAEFFTCEGDPSQLIQIMESHLPSEVIINKAQKQELLELFEKLSYKPAITKLEPWIFDVEFGREALLGQFQTQSLKGFGIEQFTLGIAAAGAILHYVNETQNGQLAHIKKISAYLPSEFMLLDNATRRNLEITYSMADGSHEGTLFSILDKTHTPMGGRLFKSWLGRPLKNIDAIKSRLTAVRAFVNDTEGRMALRSSLNKIGDMERLIQKICTGRANPRDVVSLALSLDILRELASTLAPFEVESIQKIRRHLHPIDEVVDLIKDAILPEPTVQLGTGSVFQRGFSDELDSLVSAKTNAKAWLDNFQENERSISGIPSLKIGFNNVFGYYIEISNAHKSKVPSNYDRKQTLTNAERYTTPELKEFEEKILNAEEKIASLEQSLFVGLRLKISNFTEQIQNRAYYIAVLDCLLSYAFAAVEYNYCEPEIDESEIIEITEGRHPVVERVLPIGSNYTANSTTLNPVSEQIHVITGPNMSGKSCYLRQVGLCVLMAQIGSFVAAKSARIGLVDRIFTRVGAQDNISAGESTFLVEMQEAANIMNNASSKSLLLLDEVGRGTATFDGISIAWSIAEYIHEKIAAKTLFATHYHELNELESRFSRIKNYKVEVIEAGGTVIFTHKVCAGASDHSFGIHVAQMAGLPEDIINRAYFIMKSFEDNANSDQSSSSTNIIHSKGKKNNRIPDQLSIFEYRDDSIREQILKLDLENITPLESLKILMAMKDDIQKNRKA